MPTIAVVTDSSACIPGDLAASLGITVVPITIHLPDRDLHDGMAEAPSAVYAALRRGDPVKSSAPTPAQYLTAIDEREADGVLVITPAAEFTGMLRSATIAADLAAGPVTVVDSRTAAAAQGLVVLAAAEAASSGAGLDQATAAAEEAARRADLVAALEGVDRIRHSGRVPPMALGLARRLGVRPVFRFRQGAAERIGVPRSEAAALDRIAHEYASRGAARAAVFHAAAPERAGDLTRRIGDAGLTVEFSPSMGIHTGAGVVGVAWLADAP